MLYYSNFQSVFISIYMSTFLQVSAMRNYM